MENETEDISLIHISDESSSYRTIEQMILNIRGCQVMLDRDLASLYGVETKVLNQAVKRNIERFPDDFRFQLTKEECLRSQIVTFKYLPYAFTENGIAMLSSVLRSRTAIEMNIRIMRAFTSIRHIIAYHFVSGLIRNSAIASSPPSYGTNLQNGSLFKCQKGVPTLGWNTSDCPTYLDQLC